MSDTEMIRLRIKMIVAFLTDGKISNFAKKTGISYQTINNWIGKATSLPGAEHMMRICIELKVNANWLLLGEGLMISIPQIHAMTGIWKLPKKPHDSSSFFGILLDELKTNPSHTDDKALFEIVQKKLDKRKTQMKPILGAIEQAFSRWSRLEFDLRNAILKVQDLLNQLDEYTKTSLKQVKGGEIKDSKVVEKLISDIEKRKLEFDSTNRKLEDCEIEINALLRVIKE